MELGVGVAGRYDRTIVIYGDRVMEDKDWINCTFASDASRFLFGINYCIRLYAIRNDKFDLFGFYEPRTNFSEGFKNYYWNSSTAGIAFSVKF